MFTTKGFRPAGISDVAGELGLSHGAVYTYADSKQALLYLALLRAMDPDAVALLTVPVTAPAPDAIVEVVRTWAGKQGSLEAVAALLRGVSEDAATPPSASAEVDVDVEHELQMIVDALYGLIENNRTVLQLVARCSEELPELAQWYFVENRRSILARLGEFLTARIEAGLLAPVPDVAVAARFIVETIAWFAMHRHGDPDSAMLSDEACRSTVRQLVPAAFAPTRPAVRNES